jgi:hypothetical protein
MLCLWGQILERTSALSTFYLSQVYYIFRYLSPHTYHERITLTTVETYNDCANLSELSGLRSKVSYCDCINLRAVGVIEVVFGLPYHGYIGRASFRSTFPFT